MEVVNATLKHLDLLAPLFNLYREFYGKKDDAENSYLFIKERLEKKDSIILLAINDVGYCIGFMQIFPSLSSLSTSNIWVLNDLYVVSEHRGLGVARMLMNELNCLAIMNKVSSIILETDKTNRVAQGIYESLGYTRETMMYHYRLNLND
ncbi:GNAT family N-acetyltransferase [Vibrio cholerae]|uniref:GNAT family N-acetyltransferase n=1 Tax=Vibrio cholerae TaxID=666 RepID=UPI0015828EE8|nr:N-acetyltransferase [Vibrio cholerae]ELI1752149.1 GNAT family N-acetyltransferase [Vibrio cholerae]ELJ8538356.1 GNAT family N-acetyltransferase [Vibrio cholerae]ELJ8579376.1 GNAT family N-acetyltransferase [Vibrio cholerae]MDV2372620.1 N-acetyltransferase [Vibrio cholerae]QKV01884.1 GNAT family N-acetyltransferase [Vibrio cholerae]